MTDKLTLWFIIFASAAITFGCRSSFILFANPDRFPPWFRRALSFVPAAALCALIAPGLAIPAGTLTPDLGNPRLWAGLIAFAVAWYFNRAIATIGAGMGALWLWQAFGPVLRG